MSSCLICEKEFIKIGNQKTFCCSKECSKIYHKEYEKKYQKKYQLEHKNDIKEYKNQHYKDNKEEINKKHNQYYQDNKEKIRKQQQERRQLPERKIIKKDLDKKYRQKNKEKIKKQVKKYSQSPTGSASIGKTRAKRKKFQFNPLNGWFKNSEGHHIDEINVIYIPEKLHKSIRHSVLKNINMNEINIKSWSFMESQTY